MEPRAEIVNLDLLTKAPPDFWTTYGPLGVICFFALVGVFFFSRWAINKIDESGKQIVEMQKVHQAQLEATHMMYGERMKELQGQFANRMEELTGDFKQVVLANTQAMNDMRTELRILAENRGWDGKERRHVQ